MVSWKGYDDDDDDDYNNNDDDDYDDDKDVLLYRVLLIQDFDLPLVCFWMLMDATNMERKTAWSIMMLIVCSFVCLFVCLNVCFFL